MGGNEKPKSQSSFMIIYLCNALDEKTRNTRHITTDSPAATKKVLGLCRAMHEVGEDCIVLSMGRGRQSGSGERFLMFTKVLDGVDITYSAFWHIPFLTHLVTSMSLAISLWRLKRMKAVKLLAYNRVWHYLPSLLLAKVLSIPCYLDLEDGWVSKKNISQKMLTYFYDWACNAGSLLACDALKEQVNTKNNLVCYGTSSVRVRHSTWRDEDKVQVLFGGTLCEGTGAHLFIEAIKILLQKNPLIAEKLQIVVVGFGEMAKSLELFSLKTSGLVGFRGSVSNEQYTQLLQDSHIGLCLKLIVGPFNDSTFPSKVIEISSYGLLLISTSVSDVPKIFSSSNAILLRDDNPESLADALQWVVQHRLKAEDIAMKGGEMARECFSMEEVGLELVDFFKGDQMI